MLLGDLAANEGVARDLGYIWLSWFAIALVEGYTARESDNGRIFDTLFEICSAWGSVGLSLGSAITPNASFSADLRTASQVCSKVCVPQRAQAFARMFACARRRAAGRARRALRHSILLPFAPGTMRLLLA